MNSSPIIFLLVSGSDTPFNFSKNKFLASTLIKFKSPRLPNTSSTSKASFLRSRPWSTKIQVKLEPTALLKSIAATLLSTPPERAHKTFLLPILFFNSLIFCSMK